MTTVARNDIASAMAYCERITRQRARNFYHGLRLAPDPKRSALYALYAWMRQADDLVDAAAPLAVDVRPQLDRFRTLTDATLRGEIVADASPMWVALRDCASRYALDPVHFHDMLDGQLADLTVRVYATFPDLRAYCRQVASSVGLLCIRIWGYTDREAERHAVDRGVAFQLTNILRDLAEDHDAGRDYLPQEDFAKFGLSPAALRAWAEREACESLMKFQVERARRLYESSRPLDDMVSPDCQPVLWAMTEIYSTLLEKIARTPKRAATGGRVRLNLIRKGFIALEARRRVRAALEPQA